MAIVSADTCEAKHMRYADSDYDEDDDAFQGKVLLPSVKNIIIFFLSLQNQLVMKSRFPLRRFLHFLQERVIYLQLDLTKNAH